MKLRQIAILNYQIKKTQIMKVKTAYSQKATVNEIVADIKIQLGSFDAKLIQLYASSNFQPKKISAEMQKAFPGIPMMGCTTAGEIVTGKMLDNSVVAMAFSSEIIQDCKIEVLPNILKDEKAVDTAFDSFSQYYHDSMANLDSRKYVGFVLIDGLSRKEEKINERIGDLTNITFIGGSAGDDSHFKKTYIFANGKTYENAAVLALIKCNTAFDFLKTQSFVATPEKMTITKVDEPNRTIIEINHKPAVDEYARLVGKDKQHITEAFFSNPLGLGSKDDIFVRSPQKVEGSHIVFYCSIKEGMELILLKATDIVEDTQRTLNEKRERLGGISAIVNFHCILRTIELKAEHKTGAYGEIFKDIPTVGFSTYGESYIGHINQTSTMVLFK
jgi:hypothetical protein